MSMNTLRKISLRKISHNIWKGAKIPESFAPFSDSPKIIWNFRTILLYLYPKTVKMRIISKSTLVEYYTKNPLSKTALEEWYEKTKKAEWTCFADIKNTFNSVDAVGNQRYVFNIKGNDYRLVVLILFTPKTVYIRFVGTHSEYDAIKDIKNI